MDFRSPEGPGRYDALLAVAANAVVCLDFDGTLSPIVDDPASAHIHPDAPGVLLEVAPHVRAVAIVTGRPARQVVALGTLEEVARRLEPGARLVVMGQYGNERWDSDSREFVTPEPPAGLEAFRRELDGLLAEAEATDALVEEKGLAVAVHTRRLPDPQGTFDRLEPLLTDAARGHGLAVEPGRLVLEVRAPGMHKGGAVEALAEELGAQALVFAGDDLGDLEAFTAVSDLRAGGLPGVLVCSGSQEQEALVERADLVVDGPSGVLAFLRQLAADAAARARRLSEG